MLRYVELEDPNQVYSFVKINLNIGHYLLLSLTLPGVMEVVSFFLILKGRNLELSKCHLFLIWN